MRHKIQCRDRTFNVIFTSNIFPEHNMTEKKYTHGVSRETHHILGHGEKFTKRFRKADIKTATFSDEGAIKLVIKT